MSLGDLGQHVPGGAGDPKHSAFVECEEIGKVDAGAVKDNNLSEAPFSADGTGMVWIEVTASVDEDKQWQQA